MRVMVIGGTGLLGRALSHEWTGDEGLPLDRKNVDIRPGPSNKGLPLFYIVCRRLCRFVRLREGEKQQLDPIRNTQSIEDFQQVVLDRMTTQPHARSNLTIGESFGQMMDHF